MHRHRMRIKIIRIIFYLQFFLIQRIACNLLMSACLDLWLNIILSNSINLWLRLKASYTLLSAISGNSLFRPLLRPLLSRTFDLVGKLLDSILSILNVCSYESSNVKKNLLRFRTNNHYRSCQAQFEPCEALFFSPVKVTRARERAAALEEIERQR